MKQDQSNSEVNLISGNGKLVKRSVNHHYHRRHDLNPVILTKFTRVTAFERSTIILPCVILNLPVDMHVWKKIIFYIVKIDYFRLYLHEECIFWNITLGKKKKRSKKRRIRHVSVFFFLLLHTSYMGSCRIILYI